MDSHTRDIIALNEHAREEINIARENGTDPHDMARAHRALAEVIDYLVALDDEEESK